MATESTIAPIEAVAQSGQDRRSAAAAAEVHDKLYAAATPSGATEKPVAESAPKQTSRTSENVDGNQFYSAFKSTQTPAETARLVESYRRLSPIQQAAMNKDIEAAAAKDPEAAKILAQINQALYGDTFKTLSQNFGPELRTDAPASISNDVGSKSSKPAELVRTDDTSTPPAKTSDLNSDSTPRLFDKQLAGEQQSLVQSHPGVLVSGSESLLRDKAALKNVQDILASAGTPSSDKLRAAAVLAANGQSELKTAQGGTYNFKNLANGSTELSFKESAQSALQKITGQVDKDGSLLSINGQPVEKKTTNNGIAPEAGANPLPEVHRTPKDTLFDPSSSMEEKLKAADAMAKSGQRNFVGPDGKQYAITTQKYGDRESVDVQMGDGHGHAHPVLRGILEKNGDVKQQQDKHGRGVDFTSDWRKRHDADSNLTKHDQPRQAPEHHETPEVHEQPSPQTPRTELDEARDRLRDDAQKNITDGNARREFLAHMDQFEQRAKNENVPEKQVSDTYKQLSRLLEAQEGKAPKEDRVLAAESFALHMADPKTMDQGQHNTCNVTSVAKREMFINPSTQAEMITTVALTGEYVASDGKHIKIDQDSLTPGREESKLPPVEPGRTYATQLMTLAMVNDVLQRRMPPEYYSQGRVEGIGDTGERVVNADGTPRATFPHEPGIWVPDLQALATRLDGRPNSVLANDTVLQSENLQRFGTEDEFKARLREMKENHNLPAVIMVDVSDPIYGWGGDRSKPGVWHMVIVDNYDENTGKIRMLNQWGRQADMTMNVSDLYRTTHLPSTR